MVGSEEPGQTCSKPSAEYLEVVIVFAIVSHEHRRGIVASPKG